MEYGTKGDKIPAANSSNGGGERKEKERNGVGMGRDYTLFALIEGDVQFSRQRNRLYMNVVSSVTA